MEPKIRRSLIFGPINNTHNFGKPPFIGAPQYGRDQGTLGVHSAYIIKGLGGGRVV